MTIHRLEELSTPELDALDRARTVVILTVSPLETHGPHLPLGVDAFTARHFAESIAGRLVSSRPGWAVVLAPTLHLGSFTFDSVGTMAVRQRVVRDAVVDYGSALGRAGFRHVLVSNGHGGPGHLVALEEAAAIVSRRHRITMASFTGHLAWEFLRGRFLPRIEAGLGRPLSEAERQAFSEDAHGGWWETSIMLVLRPDLVDDGYRTLPAARYSLAERLRSNYAVRNGGRGYVGHPAMADPTFARVTTLVLMDEAMAVVNGLLDGRLRPSQRRSPFFSIPFFRTDFRRAAGTAALALAALAAWWILG
ncbi:MAG: creatininase family protein [Candidatus Rokuibacteriota bacterium]